MFKFDHSEPPQGQDEGHTKAENFALGKEAELESYKAIIAERETELKSLQAERDSLNERIASIIGSVTKTLDDPSAYEDFSNNTELPALKAELAHMNEEIARFDNLPEQRKQVRETEVNLEKLKSGNTEVRNIDAEIEHLSRDPNGEREASHRKVSADVDTLVAVRAEQLKEKDKVESMIAILDSLDEQQKAVFLSKLKPEDKKLIEDYKSGALYKIHEEALSATAEKQDPELFEAKEAERQADLKRRTFGGYVSEKGVEEFEGYKIGDRLQPTEEEWFDDDLLYPKIFTHNMSRIVGFIFPHYEKKNFRSVNNEITEESVIIEYRNEEKVEYRVHSISFIKVHFEIAKPLKLV